MANRMTVSDWFYIALIAVGLLLDYFTWPSFLRRSKHDQPSARRWLWSVWMLLQWTMAGAGIALWLFHRRAWATLGLSLPRGWRLWGSVIVVGGCALMQVRTAVRVARVSGPKPKARARLGEVAIALPHTADELRWFIALSLTAGFCEEFLCRGYLIWAFQPWLGWWGAAALAVPVFAAAHAYQGKAGVIRTGLIGAVFVLFVAVSGSLIPVIVLHAVIDILAGVITWLILRDEPAPVTLQPVPVSPS
jgi:membrane protease YdiL (CAAX protease family)